MYRVRILARPFSSSEAAAGVVGRCRAPDVIDRTIIAADNGPVPAHPSQHPPTPDRAATRVNLVGVGRSRILDILQARCAAVEVPAPTNNDALGGDRHIRPRPLGFRAYHAAQVYDFIHRQGVFDFARMTSLSKELRDFLDENFSIDLGSIQTSQKSIDGTTKLLLQFQSPSSSSPPPSSNPDSPPTFAIRKSNVPVSVETVLIPEPSRSTVCVSSQAGCSLRCTFCHTGTQKLMRNLTASEIVAQVFRMSTHLNDFPLNLSSKPRRLSNIVFMGQGEPLYNYRNVAEAVNILADETAFGLSRQRITISTSGVVPLIMKMGEETGCNLAVSLHASNNDLRSELVPLNKTYPLQMLMEACHEFCEQFPQRKITFEYVMLKNVNDRESDARDLIRLLAPLRCYVNLIPFNTWPGAPYECSAYSDIEKFADRVAGGGVRTIVRWPRGRDILAACGQLNTAFHSDQKKE